MRDIKRVLVLGANGTMGAEVAALFASRGFQVAALARTQDKAVEGLRKAREAARSDVIDRVIHW
ncbi:MAG TPA: 3-hydroxyacyl-CoA dehydrogenase NAD-binding domain-containing protein, partial [Polyangiaceae bacterium]|nr:3-hydroxyacyl-CoA dehydrogenase NAD-binding domain-containing protein [Polyangiaceae bacterium]